MSMFTFPPDVTDPEIESEARDEYLSIVERFPPDRFAITHDTVTLRIAGVDYRELRVLVAARSEAWRIPALLALLDAYRGHGWSDGAEVIRSTLLGLTEADLNACAEHAMRLLPARIAAQGLRAHHFFDWVAPIAALPVEQPRLSLVRVGIGYRDLIAIFGDQQERRHHEHADLLLTPENVAAFNRCLESSIQRWNGSSWTD